LNPVSLLNQLRIKKRILAIILSAVIFYFIYLTFLASFWRIDTHHDGYVYLSASLAANGKLPPNVLNHHGIASPFIEGILLKFTLDNLVSYRLIGFVVICITAFVVYKIIASRHNKLTALSFSLLWLCGNPSWAGSLKQPPTGIQSVWPNLWVQLFTLMGLYIILKNKKLSITRQITLGVLVGTLPFFRIQAVTCLIFLISFSYLKFKKWQIYMLVSSLLTCLFWLAVISSNGGIPLYLKNILGDPLSKKDYAEFISANAIFYNIANKIKYYIVISILFAVIYLLFLLLKNQIKKNLNIYQIKITLFTMSALLILLTIKHFSIWTETLYVHGTALLIDLSVPLSFIYLVWTIIARFTRKIVIFENETITLIGLASLNLLNLLNQFPLSDRGHKWWSSADSVLFLAYFIQGKIAHDFSKKSNFNFKYFTIFLLIVTVIFSFAEGVAFQRIERVQIQNQQFTKFNGIYFPKEDSELVDNFFKTSQILTNLESKHVEIFYKCGDGLYYIRQHLFANGAQVGLSKDVQIKLTNPNEVIFICNSAIDSNMNLSNFNSYSIGKNFPNLFLVQKNSPLTEVVKKIITQA
jgi:hypothetical protein